MSNQTAKLICWIGTSISPVLFLALTVDTTRQTTLDFLVVIDALMFLC